MSSDIDTRKRIPENVKRWRANAAANARAKREAERAAIRTRQPSKPRDIRTYGVSPTGIDYDAAIRAAAISSVPYPESPNRGTKR